MSWSYTLPMRFMAELIKNKEEIDKIIDEKIKGKKIVYTKYYGVRLASRGLEHKRVKEIFPQFDKVFAIEKEKLKFGDIGYELFYSLSNNITFSIATVPKKDRIEIIHAIEYKRSLGKRLRQM